MSEQDTTVTTSDPPAALPSSLLLVLSSPSAGAIESRSLPARGAVTIGRSSECTVVVDDASLSRRHATLRVPELTIIDHASRNGTWIAETRLAQDAEGRIAIGRPFRLGHVSAIVVRVGAIDRGVLAQLDARLARARQAGDALIVIRGDTRTAVPAWPGIAVLAATEELWLAVLERPPGEVAATREAIHREPGFGSAVSTTHGADANALYLSAERDRIARRDARPAAIEAVQALAERVAKSTVNVLIQGETGAGKEVLAELVHRCSPRAAAPLVKVNCAAMAANLFESQMFGHERGAFTGAVDSRDGLIASADGGTLFLDEIAELPLELQAKLLRVIEDRIVMRVGAVVGKRIDVRFVTATNEQLQARVAAGTFRADLYFRLAGVTIDVPPLRERKDEIKPLAELFVLRAAEAMRIEAPVLSPEALATLREHAWPGNVRQLRNVVERAVILCDAPVIRPEHLQLDEAARAPVAAPPPAAAGPLDPDKPEHLLAALAQCAGNQTSAAKLLGISRNTLLARLDQFGLPRPRKKDA